MIDDILEQYNLTDDKLNPEEWETLNRWLKSLQEGQLTVDRIRIYIHALRQGVEKDLTEKKDVNYNFLTLLTFLIPLIGIIRKWYQDQREIELKARLRCYMVMEQLMDRPEQAKQQLKTKIASMSDGEG